MNGRGVLTLVVILVVLAVGNWVDKAIVPLVADLVGKLSGL